MFPGLGTSHAELIGSEASHPTFIQVRHPWFPDTITRRLDFEVSGAQRHHAAYGLPGVGRQQRTIRIHDLSETTAFWLSNTDVEACHSCGRLPRVLSLGLRFPRPSILNPLHLVLAKGFLPYSPAESGKSIFCLLSEEQEALFPRQSSDFCQESAETRVVFNSSCFARACGTALCLESNPHGDRQLTPAQPGPHPPEWERK